MEMVPSRPLKLFYSYAHEDEKLREELEKRLVHLRWQGLISEWHDRLIVPGTNWAQAIDSHLKDASIILLLISPDFLASDYCYGIEMKMALERNEKGEATVIPVHLRLTDWKEAPFAHLQALPKDAIPVIDKRWHSQDDAFFDIAQGITRIAKSFSSITQKGTSQSVLPQPRQISSGRDLAPRKGWLVWIIILLFVLAEVVQITCLSSGWESPWIIAATVLIMLTAIIMLFQVTSMLPDWHLFKSSHSFIKVAGNQLFQRVIFILLLLAIIALPTFASLSHIFVTIEFPGLPRSDTLLTNGSFEQGTTGWDCDTGTNIQIYHENNKSWMQASTPSNNHKAICVQNVRIKPKMGKTYIASVSVYTSAISIDGHIALWMFDANDPSKTSIVRGALLQVRRIG